MQIKTTVRYHLITVRLAIIKKCTNNKYWRGCEEKATLLDCWWKHKLVQPLKRTVQRSLKKLKIEVPYDSAIPFVGIYPEKTLIWKDKCTSVFIAKTWKQPKCPSTDEQTKKMWYKYMMEYYSVIKNNKIMPFAATWMDLEIITLSEISQRKTNIIWYHFYVKSKMWYKLTYLWNKNRLTVIENRIVVAKGGWG